MELGRTGASVAALETALKLAPQRTRAYYSLAGAKTFLLHDPAIEAMAALVETSPDEDSDGRIHLHFALGKAFADIGEPLASFKHLIAGAAIKRAETPYDEAFSLALLDRTKAAITRGAIVERCGQGDPSRRPIFMVGKPRCGSTLVEQILSSHPQIHGADDVSTSPRRSRCSGRISVHLCSLPKRRTALPPGVMLDVR